MTEVRDQSSCGQILNTQGGLEVETKCELGVRKNLEMTERWVIVGKGGKLGGCREKAIG